MSTLVKILNNEKVFDFKSIILALQHLIAMFGATVLVPMLTGLDPAVALFSAGVGTLIFHYVTDKKVPVFLGSSFAFIPLIITVKNMYGGDLAYAQGGIIVAGLIYVLVSFLIKKIGMKNINKILPPHVIGPMIMVIGLNLIPVAFDMASNNYFLAGITLISALSIKFFGKGFSKQLMILGGVLIGYTVAAFTIGIDTSVISETSWIAIPSFTLPKFSLNAILIIAPVVLAVFMEHIGDITTNQTVVGKNFIKDPGLNKTLLGDGLATIFAGFIGGPANTTYGENTGVLAITKNYKPKILRIAAVFAILLALVAKVGASLKTIPVSVMGGISIILFSMIALIGIKTIKDNEVEFNFKNNIVMFSILLIGFGGSYIKKIYDITLGIKITENITIEGLAFAALVGIILNILISKIKR